MDPALNMLVLGESILNDAVAIVLTTTIVESSFSAESGMSTTEQIASYQARKKSCKFYN